MNLNSLRNVIIAALVATPSVSAADKRPIVIIHGAWGGAHHWQAVDQALTRDHRRTVRRVSLTGLGERRHLASRDVDLDTHIQDVVNIIDFDELTSVVLVAHSYGGVVGQGVVNEIPERIAEVFYIDSHLLEDGECYFTHHADKREKSTQRANEDGDGWLIPVDWDKSVRDTPHPLATLTQKITLKSRQSPVKASYWLLADGRPPEKDERYRYYERAVADNLTTKILPWKHNPQRDRPDEFVTELIGVLDASPPTVQP